MSPVAIITVENLQDLIGLVWWIGGWKLEASICHLSGISGAVSLVGLNKLIFHEPLGFCLMQLGVHEPTTAMNMHDRKPDLIAKII